jgi:hypothetical protein
MILRETTLRFSHFSPNSRLYRRQSKTHGEKKSTGWTIEGWTQLEL